ncbi:ATP-binding protein [Curvivirga aplysinae]|uniref:ATP-binding protein n=1 Tax=Curvivirga aplysinae TaxID=2529852 RepID=UPI0012BC6132|nr:ATP-binding protein [Curvivirga aplysinae]MTI10693.1 response regulator [Curvivirga aplysinae]
MSIDVSDVKEYSDERDMPRRTRLGLKWRLLLFVFIILLAGFSGTAYLRISEGYETRRTFLLERAELALNTLSETITTPLWYLNNQSVERAIDSAIELKDVKRIILVGNDGLNVIRENVRSSAVINADSYQVLTEKLYWQEDDENGQVKKTHLADLTMEIALTQADEYLSAAIWNTIISYSVIMMVLMVVFWAFLHKLTGPLEQMAGYLRYIGSNRSAGHVKELAIPYQSEQNEIGQLARSLERIRLHSVELLDLRSNLEGKVSEQTHELLEARDLAEAASEAKSNFLANVTHELRTPLNAVLGMAELLKSTNLDKSQKEYTDLIVNSGDALLVLIGDLLDMAQLEKKTLELKKAPFQLTNITTGLRRNFAESLSISKSELIVRNDFSEENWFKGDLRRIKQVLFALISNAIKFTQDGKIAVTVSMNNIPERGWSLTMTVEDTGIGISQEDQDKLFDHFMQLEGDLTRRFAGMGTGLALVSSLVEMMDGKISIQSEKGKGSTFTVILPLDLSNVQADSTIDEVKEEEASETSMNRKLNVLVAEDNPVNQMLLLKILEQAGHKVFATANGKEAVHAVRNDLFDIVLMDIQMPEMDGLTAHRLIRTIEGAKGKIPVIAVTANTLDTDIERYTEEGFDGFIGKPVNPQALLSVMAKLCGEGGVTAEKIIAEAAHREEISGKNLDEDEQKAEAIIREIQDAMGLPLLDEVQWNETSEAIGEDTLINLMVEVPDELDKYAVNIKELSQAENLDALKKEAHALKGLAANSALSRLARIGSLISIAAGQGENPVDFVEELAPVNLDSKQALYKKLTG